MAKTVDLGRVDSYGEPVTSLVLEATDPLPEKPKGVWGRNQAAAVTALKEWSRSHPGVTLISTIEFNALLSTQGIRPKRRREIQDSLVNARILTPSIGGWTFDPAAL